MAEIKNMKITGYILKVLSFIIEKHKYSYEIAMESLISGVEYIEIYYNLELSPEAVSFGISNGYL